eukprot:956430-Prymnesium_polylepis.1
MWWPTGRTAHAPGARPPPAQSAPPPHASSSLPPSGAALKKALGSAGVDRNAHKEGEGVPLRLALAPRAKPTLGTADDVITECGAIQELAEVADPAACHRCGTTRCRADPREPTSPPLQGVLKLSEGEIDTNDAHGRVELVHGAGRTRRDAHAMQRACDAACDAAAM